MSGKISRWQQDFSVVDIHLTIQLELKMLSRRPFPTAIDAVGVSFSESASAGLRPQPPRPASRSTAPTRPVPFPPALCHFNHCRCLLFQLPFVTTRIQHFRRNEQQEKRVNRSVGSSVCTVQYVLPATRG